MMEIAFGPVIVACAAKSLAFGLLFAVLFPLVERRLAPGRRATSIGRRLGLGLLGGGLFGLAHLTIVCAADGFPPRIIQSAAVALALLALSGFGLVRRQAPMRSL